MPSTQATTTRPHSEADILACIASHFSILSSDVLLGPGDDCAVLKSGDPLCISTDLFIENVHFRRSYFSAEDIGWKALAVNLSDLAACGASPAGFTVGLSLPPDTDMDIIHGLCTGMASLARQASIPLIGGDLSRADRLHLCLTVFGRTKAALRRGVAIPGDAVFLIGDIGLARIGLILLEQQGRPAIATWPAPCAAHLHPMPNLDAGLSLAHLATVWCPEQPELSRIGLMDVSDGLARDLPRLLGAYGAELHMPQLHPAILNLMQKQGESDPIQAARTQALQGGEDYALLGTCPPDRWKALLAALPSACLLGFVTASNTILMDGTPLYGGFDHFS